MTTKQHFLGLAALLLCTGLSAQTREQDQVNPDLLRYVTNDCRTEIVIPGVDGFDAIKTDLHCHTFFSDADTSPEYRVREAWRDGLDALAITDHVEYHPYDKKMAAYLGVPFQDKRDLNLSVKLAQAAATSYGLTIIPGTEITRNPREIGHFNALFTKDNNAIPDPDPLVAIRNAKAQGCIVQNNHPGWARTDANLTETTKKALAEGLIDGFESVNGSEFYPKSIEDAVNNNCYVCAGTDVHRTTYDYHIKSGHLRDMTIVFAMDASIESLKEALTARRTLSYGFGTISGSKELLEKFFLASFEFKTIETNDKGVRTVLVTNKTSFPYLIDTPSSPANIFIQAFGSVRMTVKSGEDLSFVVSNMWYGVDKNLEITVKGL